MKKNILFITWDGPQTNYTEGLFMPIFNKFENLNSDFKFHYLQFTWGKDITAQENASKTYNIPYAHAKISKKPIASLGSFKTLLTGKKEIKKYIKKWNIDILMPRSNFPFFMVDKLNTDLPVIFDADGLPIEERIDFAGLKRGSFMHRFLKSIEQKAIIKSDLVLTRSQKSIDYHLKNYDVSNHNKFHVVKNGRNIDFFSPNQNKRDFIRKELKINPNATVFIYAGSFGPQYGWNEMLNIFESYNQIDSNAHFIFLTGSPEKIKPLIPKNLENKFIVKKVPFTEIPNFMNIADVAFAIRKPTLSMQGVAPIKLGEYLLMGISTIASKGIGDTTKILEEIPNTLIFDHNNPPSNNQVIDFINESKNSSKKETIIKAKTFFSLEASAKSYISALKVFL